MSSLSESGLLLERKFSVRPSTLQDILKLWYMYDTTSVHIQLYNINKPLSLSVPTAHGCCSLFTVY